MPDTKFASRISTLAICVLFLLAACSMPGAQPESAGRHPRKAATATYHQKMDVWRLDELARNDQPAILLSNSQGVQAALETRLLQNILTTGERIERAAGDGTAVAFVLTTAGSINAFAFINNKQPTIAFSLGMLRLLSDDQDAWAALFGHELAHLRLEHLSGKKDRREKTEIASSIAGVVLSVLGVPFANAAADASAMLADRAFSRDDEREADRSGLEYMRRAGFAESGAITLQQRLLTVGGDTPIPFLSTHPGGEERIENLRRLIWSDK